MSDEFRLDVQSTPERKTAKSDEPVKPKSRAEKARADVLDAIARSRDGLTIDEATQLVDAGSAVVRRTLSSLHEAGLVECAGDKRQGRSGRSLPVYRVKTAAATEGKAKPSARSEGSQRVAFAVRDEDRNPTVYQCPACSGDFVWQHVGLEHGGGPVPCDPQRRLVVFAGPYDEHDLPTEPLTGFEEGTGRLVLGRAANEAEREHYKRHGNLNGVVPWTIARHSHFTTCTRLDRWIKGDVSWRDEDDRQRKSFAERYKRP